MIRNFILLIILVLSISNLIAQENVTLDYGASYSYQMFYSFENGNIDRFPNEAWDIGFTVDEGVYGIHVNEGLPLAVLLICYLKYKVLTLQQN